MWTHELEATFITQPTNFNVSQWHFDGCKQKYLHWLMNSTHTIDVSASEAALQLLNQGKGCGRSVGGRRQPLSFCLKRKQTNIKSRKQSCFPPPHYAPQHTCKPATMKCVYSCHCCWYWGTLHIHISLQQQKTKLVATKYQVRWTTWDKWKVFLINLLE